MKMYTQGFNTMKELTKFVNDSDIKRDNIIEIFQATNGMFIISYYA